MTHRRPAKPALVSDGRTFVHAYLDDPEQYPHTEHYDLFGANSLTRATASLDYTTGRWTAFLNPSAISDDKAGLFMPAAQYDTAQAALDAITAVMRDRDYPEGGLF
jgi:hypothetical protein